uniref:Uncharacterized protein n=1 Tax=Lankesteria abbotti TaxID=340204 RepID=A0A6T5UVJ3_9APIC|mmetsp:Transcript_1081/g.1250  ORF Transcript_1081/g.1250 Transcript_1081/m.1250 type:complete len:166 (+) Transcript_1081:262-759(+)
MTTTINPCMMIVVMMTTMMIMVMTMVMTTMMIMGKVVWMCFHWIGEQKGPEAPTFFACLVCCQRYDMSCLLSTVSHVVCCQRYDMSCLLSTVSHVVCCQRYHIHLMFGCVCVLVEVSICCSCKSDSRNHIELIVIGKVSMFHQQSHQPQKGQRQPNEWQNGCFSQ